MTTNVGRWQLDHDAEATRQCFSAQAVGTSVPCDCAGCRNFMAALDRAFPPAFRALAETLGVDITKPAELCHWGREEATGFHLTGGWFHFAGSIVEGLDAFQKSGLALEPFGTGFEVGFTSELQLVPERFQLQPALTQLEFMTRVPWVISDPEGK